MSVDDHGSLPLTRVLAKRPGFYRALQRGLDLGYIYDSSSLPYLIEEFVASAAVDIAITATSPAVPHLSELHPILRQRVVIVDSDGRVGEQIAAILEPLGDELFFELKTANRELHFDPKSQPPVREIVGELFYTLYDFLLGAEYRLQVDVDVTRIQSSIDSLRQIVRSPEARATLAALSGVFGTYRPVQIASLALQSAATDDQIERFRRFVEDTRYQHVSRDAGLLGVPEEADRAVVLIQRGLRALVKAPLFKPVAGLATKVVSKATPLDVDTASVVEAILPNRYLPPIVPLDAAYKRAEAIWGQQRGAFIETDAIVNTIGPGWIEREREPQPSIADFARGSNDRV